MLILLLILLLIWSRFGSDSAAVADCAADSGVDLAGVLVVVIVLALWWCDCIFCCCASTAGDRLCDAGKAGVRAMTGNVEEEPGGDSAQRSSH